MNGTDTGFSVFGLIAHSSFGVQAIMLILFIASVISWKLIFEYNNKIKKVEKELNVFNSLFYGTKKTPAKSMPEIFEDVKPREVFGIIRVFKKSFMFLNSKTVLTKESKEAENIFKRKNREDLLKEENDYLNVFEETFDFEIDKAEQGLKNKIAVLGTISAVSPYVGLLGTVYGILIAFWNLGTAQQATIATVAPSIAEALIATGMGLFVAIPALVAYNRLNHRIDTLLDNYDKIKRTAKLLLKKNVITLSDSCKK